MRRTAPEWLLIVDPIDGTRPLMCGFAMGVISIALCRFSHKATFDDIIAGVVLEINTGDWFYAEKGQGVQVQTSQGREVQPSTTEDLSTMFWSYDTVGRPARWVSHYLGELIDSSGLQAGVFVVNNVAYCLTRIVTGHLDAHVEVGARILKDHPESEADFVRIGGGRIMGTFPYDIAACYLILQEANCVITDAYGHPLPNTQLLEQGKDAILSFVAASNASLHKKIINILPALN